MKTKVKNRGEIYAKTASSTYSEFKLTVTHTFSLYKYLYRKYLWFHENAKS
jgi:hypothetical protein